MQRPKYFVRSNRLVSTDPIAKLAIRSGSMRACVPAQLTRLSNFADFLKIDNLLYLRELILYWPVFNVVLKVRL